MNGRLALEELKLRVADSHHRLDEKAVGKLIEDVAIEHGIGATYLKRLVRADPDLSFVRSLKYKISHHDELLLATIIRYETTMKDQLGGAEVTDLVKEFSGVDVSKSWLKSFLRRHKLRKADHGRVTTRARTKECNWDSVNQFCAEMESRLRTEGAITSKTLLNLDECRVSMGRDGKMPAPIVCAQGERGNEVQITIDATTASVVPVVSAAGECWVVFVILKAHSRPTDAGTARVRFIGDRMRGRRSERRLGKPWEYIYYVTESGYVNAEIFRKMLDRLEEIWHRHRGTDIFLMLDNASCHRNRETAIHAARKGIHLIVLPPHTTSFMQPLDGHIFATFQRTFTDLVWKYCRYVEEASPSESQSGVPFYNALYDAMRLALKPKVIVGAWRDRFIWPWSSEGVKKAALHHIKHLDDQDYKEALDKTLKTTRTFHGRRSTDYAKKGKSLLENRPKVKGIVAINEDVDPDGAEVCSEYLHETLEREHVEKETQKQSSTQKRQREKETQKAAKKLKKVETFASTQNVICRGCGTREHKMVYCLTCACYGFCSSCLDALNCNKLKEHTLECAKYVKRFSK